jgi:phenylacetate-CoA ligase
MSGSAEHARASARSAVDETAESSERLATAIERARASQFYSTHLSGHRLTDARDLVRLPLTFKTHLRDASPFGMLAVPPAKAWHYHESSGTTGQPISTWSGLEEIRRMGAIVARAVPELAHDAMLLNRFPLFAPVSFVFEEAMRHAGACHIAAGTMSWDVPFTRALEFIRRLGVTALSSLPLEPILLGELARLEGLDLKTAFASVNVIFAGGAVLPPALKRVIEKDWDARVVEIYGSNETLLLGVGCTKGNMHLCPELVHAEFLDPETMAPVAPGQPGILTITSLAHDVMPLVRYVTGDLVRAGHEACTCGNDAPVAEVLGRHDERIRIDGRTVMPYDVLDAGYEFADRLGTRIFFVLIRRRGLHLLIEVEHPGSARDPAGERRLADRLGVPVTVEYLRPNDVMDRSAIFRGPKIYKPSQISDWRGDARKTITIMEALLEWPRFDAKTLMRLGLREVRNARRRRRIIKEDREP